MLRRLFDISKLNFNDFNPLLKNRQIMHGHFILSNPEIGQGVKNFNALWLIAERINGLGITSLYNKELLDTDNFQKINIAGEVIHSLAWGLLGKQRAKTARPNVD